MSINRILTLSATVGLASAWLPWERDLSLFNGTAQALASGKAARSLPSDLPMRGVNLGGE